MIWMSLAWALDLEGARARAADQAIEVARAEAAVRSASGATWVAASGALPDVGLFATASTGAGLTSFGFQRPVRSQMAIGANGSWTLIAPGSWAAANAAHHTVVGQRALLDWTRVLARRDATAAVAALWAAEAEQAAWELAAADANQAAEGIQSMVDSGLRPGADGARARALAARLRANAATAEGEVAGRCAELQALLREPIDGRCTLDAPESQDPRPADGTHPALVAAQAALRSARAARLGAVLDRAPTVTANGTVGQYVAGDNSGLGWSAGVDARLPLLSGGEGIGRNRSAAAARDDAQLALEAQERDLAAAVISAEARWRASNTSLQALQLAADAADEAMVLIQARYQEGLEGLEAWQSTRQARDEARVALARGRAEQLGVLADLESVRGVW